MRASRRQRGFTLLEVVLSISLVLGMMGGLLAFQSYALDVRKAVGEDARRIAAGRRVMDRMTAELRGASTSPFLGIGLRGQADQMQFITAAVPGAGSWIEPEPDADPIPPEHDLRLVGYRLRTATDEQGRPLLDEDGNVVIEGLDRTSQKLLTAPRVEEGETLAEVQQIEVSLVAPQFKFLRFRYWTGDTWIGAWSGGDLPQAVEITLGVEPLPAEVDVEEYLQAHETLRRVVYLPAAAKPKEGAVRRRGAAGSGGGGGGG